MKQDRTSEEQSGDSIDSLPYSLLNSLPNPRSTDSLYGDSTMAKRLADMEKTLAENEMAVAEKEAALVEKENARAELSCRFEEILNAAKLLAADFDNFRKRTEADKEKERVLATKSLINNLLPVLDQFSLCLEQSSHPEEFVKAMSLVYSQLVTLLEEAGVRPIKSLHEQFDPRVHEALMHVPSEKEENTVIEEIQKGYFLHETLLRASKVKVARQMKTEE